MNKTIYIRNEDLPLWERAREFAGEKLSPVIIEALRRFVIEQEATAKGFERLLMEFDDSQDSQKPKRKAFMGRWIFAPEEPLRRIVNFTTREDYVMAETAKGSVVVVFSRTEAFDPTISVFRIFDSFDMAAKVYPFAANEALKKRGVPVEELDI